MPAKPLAAAACKWRTAAQRGQRAPGEVARCRSSALRGGEGATAYGRR